MRKLEKQEVMYLKEVTRYRLVVALILCFCSYIVSGCMQYTVFEYKEKNLDFLADRDVIIKYFTKVDKSELLLEFDQKEIPFEMNILCGDSTDHGTIELTGYFADGEMTITILSSKTHEIWSQSYNAGLVQDKKEFEIYGGKYILRVEFDKAKKGELHLKYKTNKIFGIF